MLLLGTAYRNVAARSSQFQFCPVSHASNAACTAAGFSAVRIASRSSLQGPPLIRGPRVKARSLGLPELMLVMSEWAVYYDRQEFVLNPSRSIWLISATLNDFHADGAFTRRPPGPRR